MPLHLKVGHYKTKTHPPKQTQKNKKAKMKEETCVLLKSTSLSLFTHSHFTASLGSVTYTLNYNWDCAYGFIVSKFT
jgi:hypothetical protein